MRRGLHAALKNGFSSIYGYTSDEGGIRHAMIDDNPCDFDDAKYMLVSCSARPALKGEIDWEKPKNRCAQGRFWL